MILEHLHDNHINYDYEVIFTLAVAQRGFWDEQNTVTKLEQKRPVLNRLSESIAWETFRPLLACPRLHTGEE